jgi:hypothetical protein
MKSNLFGGPVMRDNRLRNWCGSLILSAMLFGVVGCRSLAPPQSEQLQAEEEMHRDVNPEFAEAAQVVGTLLYYVLRCFP